VGGLPSFQPGFLPDGIFASYRVVDADIQSYFDTFDHTRLLSLLQKRVSTRRVSKLIRQWLKAGVMEDGVQNDILRLANSSDTQMISLSFVVPCRVLRRPCERSSKSLQFETQAPPPKSELWIWDEMVLIFSVSTSTRRSQRRAVSSRPIFCLHKRP